MLAVLFGEMALKLGQKVRELREQQGLTQGQVAQYSGLKRSYVSLVESGEIERPSAEKLLRLAKGLHVAPEVLFEAAGYVKSPERSAEEIDLSKIPFRTYVSAIHPGDEEMVQEMVEIHEALLRARRAREEARRKREEELERWREERERRERENAADER